MTRTLWAVRLVVLAALLGANCALKTSGTEFRIGKRDVPTICFDGAPVRVLVHPACGVCGWSCLPERWQDRLPLE